MTLSGADLQQIDEWFEATRRQPGVLPEGLKPVQARLIRAVGSGTLPDSGPVFVKVMGFPRAKDRLRYAFRALPAVHEAAVLRHCRKRSVPVPEVLWATGGRGLFLPRMSMLVTAAIPAVDTRPDPKAVAAVVEALMAASVFHPDLNLGNFLTLDDGSVVVIDMQSARICGGRPDGERRAAMLAKLLADLAAEGQALEPFERELVAVGACAAADLSALRERAEAMKRAAVLGRIMRCVRESSEFRVRRSLLGTRYERRQMPTDGNWVEGGGELFRYWYGDRSLQILDSAEPVLGAVFRPFLPGKHRLYVARHGGDTLPALWTRLQDGHDRYLAIRRTSAIRRTT